MKYYYRIWCPDCLYIDPEGCFDGQVETDEEPFNTPQEALDAAYRSTQKTIYEYDVVDENGAVIQNID